LAVRPVCACEVCAGEVRAREIREDKGMTLWATQIYRREDGQWRVIHRHGDILTPIEARW
jgi:hypothetical protein